MAVPNAHSLARPPTGLTAPVLERELRLKNQNIGERRRAHARAPARAPPQPRHRAGALAVTADDECTLTPVALERIVRRARGARVWD